jgi:hypothetical protein
MNLLPLRPRLALLVALACAGCPGTLGDPSAFTPGREQGATTTDAGGCPDIPTTVFPVCASSGCHSAVDRVQNLDLQSAGVASRLVDVPAQGGGLLIDTDQPSQSVIYEKLTAAPPFGSRMPLGKPALGDDTLACVLAWVSVQTGASTGPDAGVTDAGMDAGGSDAGGTDPDAGSIGSTGPGGPADAGQTGS